MEFLFVRLTAMKTSLSSHSVQVSSLFTGAASLGKKVVPIKNLSTLGFVRNPEYLGH